MPEKKLHARNRLPRRLGGSFERSGVKPDRFEGDQQSERLRVKLERVKTHERDVRKHEKAN